MTVDRICFVSLSAYSYFTSDGAVTGGGAQRQLSLLARELTDDFEVHFVVGDYGQPREERRDNVVLHRAYTPDAASSPIEQVPKLVSLGRAMSRADADVYVHRGHPRQASVVYALTRLLGKRWVYNVANDANLEGRTDELPVIRRRTFVHGLQNAHAIIAQTEHQQARLLERFGVESSVVPNGYPPADDVLPHDEREFFLWVGRIDREQKRPHLYLDLAEALPESEFVMIGPPDEDREYYEEIERRSDSIENIDFIGGVDPDEVHEYYRRAIALVNTSAYEGFPNTFLEAARYATPVLSFEINTNRYFSGIDGYAEGEFGTLVKTVQRMDLDTAQRHALGTTFLSEYKKRYLLSAIVERFSCILKLSNSKSISKGSRPNLTEGNEF